MVQAKEGMSYTDTNSKDVMKSLTIKYGSYDDQQKQISERRKKREEIALRKSQYDEFGDEIIDPFKMDDISDFDFRLDGNKWVATKL